MMIISLILEFETKMFPHQNSQNFEIIRIERDLFDERVFSLNINHKVTVLRLLSPTHWELALRFKSSNEVSSWFFRVK